MPNSRVALRDLYATIPAFECVAGCHDCCGSVVFRGDELARLTPTERGILEAWPKILTPEDADKFLGLMCPFKGETGCAIYERRPLICRLFGHIERMVCPHGCGADSQIEKEKADMISGNYYAGGKNWLMRPIPLSEME